MSKVKDIGYKILGTLFETASFTDYLAQDRSSSERVFLKMIKKDSISDRIEDHIRFRNEVDIVSHLNHPNLLKLISHEEQDDKILLVFEYTEGKMLQDLLDTGTQLGINESLDILLKVCKALNHIHAQNHIHRNLNTQNIFINYHPDNLYASDTKLIHFGFSQIKSYHLYNRENLLKELHYIAPEQSGVLKKNIDLRSDLYSLGVVLYRLLSGKLPFTGADETSLIHQIIAKKPKPVQILNPDVPDVIDKIVAKLLEKEPEKRYQSTAGLIHDIEQYQMGQTDFPLGLDDTDIKINLNAPLIGVDQEHRKLQSLLDHAIVSHQGNICFVGGDAGTGKSRLVEEFKKYTYQKKAAMIEGKSYPGRNKVPFGSFKEALTLYAQRFDKYPEEIKKALQEDIYADLGELSHSIVQFCPALETVIGKAPRSADTMRDEKDLQIYLSIISNFLLCLGRFEKPLVIFLDDLHWADASTFELINEISRRIASSNLLLIGAYRDTEIAEDHFLSTFLTSPRENPSSIHSIQLRPFDFVATNQFVSDLLFVEKENALAVSEFIFKKSKGNPLFTLEILRNLVEENAVSKQDGMLKYDETLSRSLNISSTFIDILLKKISLFNEEETELLAYASVIGMRFDLELLFAVCELDRIQIVSIIDRAIHLQLLETDYNDRKKILFAHNKIHETFYFHLDEEKRKTLHLKIASVLEKSLFKGDEGMLLDLTDHFIQAGEKEKSLKYSYQTALKLRDNYANEEAIKYFNTTLSLLEENHQMYSDLWITCKECIGDIQLTIGKTKEAVDVFTELLPMMKTSSRKGYAYKQIAFAYFKETKWNQCKKYSFQGLQMFGQKIPKADGRILSFITKKFWTPRWPKSTHDSNSILRRMGEEDINTIAWLYYLLTWTYSLTGNKKVIPTAFKMLSFTKKNLTESKELGLCLMTFAVILAEIPVSKPAIKYHTLALDIRKKIGDEWGIAHSCAFIGFYYKCRGQFLKSISYFQESIRIYEKIGDIGAIGAGISGLASAYLNISDYQNAQKVNQRYYQLSVKIEGNFFGVVVARVHNTLLYTEKGELERAIHFGTLAYELATRENDAYSRCIAAAALSRAYLENDDWYKALDYLEIAKALYEKNEKFLKEYTVQLYPYLAETYLSFYDSNTKVLGRKIKSMLLQIKTACEEAMDQTLRWPTYHVCSLRAYAKYLDIIGDQKKAEKYFLKSIELCMQMERKYELGVSLYEYGKFLKNRQRIDESIKILESSYKTLKETGALLYKNKVGRLLDIKDEDTSSMERFTRELRDKQGLSSLFHLTQDISSILDINELLDRAMSIVLEFTCAEKACLALRDPESGHFVTRIEKNIDGTKADPAKIPDFIIHEVIATNAPVWNSPSDVQDSPQTMATNLYMPIHSKKELLGICYFELSFSSSLFLEKDMELLSVILTQLAISIENAHFYSHLEQLVEKRTEELTQTNQKLLTTSKNIKNLLNHAGQGFLSFGADMMVSEDHSNECRKIFGKDIGGCYFPEIIYPSDLEQKNFLTNILQDILLGNDENKRHMFLQLLPPEISLNGRDITIEYKHITDNISDASRIMAILTDITDKRKLQSKMDFERKVLKMVVRVVVNYNEFVDTVKEYKTFCDRTLKLLPCSENALSDATIDILRYIHTFKGNFSQFEMVHLPGKLHDLEADISSKRHHPSASSSLDLKEFIERQPFLEWLNDDIAILKDILGEQFFKMENVFMISEEKIKELEKRAMSLLTSGEYKAIIPSLRELRHKSLKQLLSNYAQYTVKTAHRLNKSIHPVQITGDEILIDTEIYGPFIKSLIHIFRNMVDHGIETNEERVSQGKSESGTILCNIQLKKHNIIIQISDDGKGMDIERLRQRAIEKGLLSVENSTKYTKSQILNFAFADEFSTKEDITDLSGRGVGLSAVKKEVENLKGTIQVKSSPGEGSCFVISLPARNYDTLKEIHTNNLLSSIKQTASDIFTRDYHFGTLVSSDFYKIENTRIPLKDVSSFISIKGVINGGLILSVDRDTALQLVSAFSLDDIPPGEENQWMEDSVAECANNIIGNSIGNIGEIEEFVRIDTPIALNSTGGIIRFPECDVWSMNSIGNHGNIDIIFVLSNV